jgi:pimeloyl-ACP methyl ester carboxylesterase
MNSRESAHSIEAMHGLQTAAEFSGITWHGPPNVRRDAIVLADGRELSLLRWGTNPPEILLLHGGAQNAHTWDTVALALDRPVVALDLPGHGHSSWRDDRRYDAVSLSEDVATAMGNLFARPCCIVGMSLGGLTAVVLASRHPDLIRALVVVDVTPGVTRDKAASVIAFVDGPESFPTFEAMLDRAAAFQPGRPRESLRRGVSFNSRQRADGSWEWRYDRRRRPDERGVDYAALWEHLARVQAPVLLVRGSRSPVVDDADAAEFTRCQPEARTMVVEGAGHNVQSDRPKELAATIGEFADSIV